MSTVPQVKKLEAKDKTFTANGKKYTLSDMISVARWKEYEKLEPELSYGVTFSAMYKNLSILWSYLNERKFADAAVVCHNLMAGVKDVDNDKRIHPALLMCALFINREGEDTAAYSREIAEEKILDWQEEGLNMMDFFTLALNTIHGFRETYLLFIQKQAEELLEESKQ